MSRGGTLSIVWDRTMATMAFTAGM